VIKLDLEVIIRETAANFAAVSLLPNAEFSTAKEDPSSKGTAKQGGPCKQ
jgi:hypothetical protein